MSLSKENKEKIIFGGVYTIDKEDFKKCCPNQLRGLNDQQYGLWIPAVSIMNNEEVYHMIDTYQVNPNRFEYRHCPDAEIVHQGLIEGLEELKNPEKGQHAVNYVYNYFYSAIIKVTDENINMFKLNFDLHDFDIISEEDARYYNDEDIRTRVRLYYEHKYPTGITLLRRGSQINFDKKLTALIYDIQKGISKPYASKVYNEHIIKEYKDLASLNKASYNKDKLQKVEDFLAFLYKQEQECQNYIKENKVFDYED